MPARATDTRSVSRPPQPVKTESAFDFLFVPVPMGILARRDIEWIDKLLVGRILSFGGQPCFLSQAVFAREFGVHRQRINERLAHLESLGIIATQRYRRGKAYVVTCDVRQTGQVPKMSAKPDTQMSDKPDRNMSAKPDTSRQESKQGSRCARCGGAGWLDQLGSTGTKRKPCPLCW